MNIPRLDATPHNRPTSLTREHLDDLAGEEDTLNVSRVLQYDSVSPRSALVECRVEDQPLPADPTSGRPVEEPTTAMGGSQTIESTYVREDDGWLLSAQVATVRNAEGQPLMRIEDRRTDEGWTEQAWLLADNAADTQFRRPIDGGKVSQDELQRAAEQSVSDVLQRDASMVDRTSFLQDRYGNLRNANILELGSFSTTVVPRALLSDGSGNRYTALDSNPVALNLQREALDHVGGYAAANSEQIVGDLNRLPVADASQDLVVAYASFPLGAPAEHATAALDEVRRVLKPGGEMVIAGWSLANSAPGTVAYLLQNFEVASTPQPGYGVVLRKPGAI